MFVVTALVTLMALAYAIESYRGRWLWHRYRADLEAKGEVFHFRRLIPSPIPDDQNFFMTPLLRPFSDYVVDEPSGTVRLRDPEACERVSRMFAWTSRLRHTNPGWPMGQFRDLASYQQQLRDTNVPPGGPVWMLAAPTNQAEWAKARKDSLNATVPALQALAARPSGKPAEDLLFLLALNQAELDEIRAAARRPAANLKARYEDGMRLLLPQLSVVKALAQPLGYSALAHLAQDDPVSAARDVVATLKLGESLASEPVLIAGLVHIAVRDLAVQPLWEGLARHQWGQAQLEEFEAALKRANAVKFMRRCLQGEQAFSISMIGSGAPTEGAAGPGVDDAAARAYASLPAPIKYQSQLQIARLYQQQVFPAFDPGVGTVDLTRLGEGALEARLGGRHPYHVLARMTVAPVCAAARSAAKAQATFNLARVAVALERYRLAQGDLPEKLADLAPRFLDPVPPDPVNGQPLRYRRGEGDRFTLYSVAVNGRDDGGAVALGPKQSPASKASVGDWVWQNYPVTNTVTTTGVAGAD